MVGEIGMDAGGWGIKVGQERSARKVTKATNILKRPLTDICALCRIERKY